MANEKKLIKLEQLDYYNDKILDEISKAAIQVSTMPTPSASLVGKIVQFTGTTGGSYTNGYFYKCTEPTSGTYAWEAVNVQAGGGGGGSYVDIRTTDPVNPSTGQMWVLVSS